MPTYKYVYFNAKGRGEIPRLLFKQVGEEFEDARLTFEQWPEHKPQMPFGALPVLFVDDKPIHQSGAIIRYLARQFGLYGKDTMEATKIDMILDTNLDVFHEFVKIHFEKDEEKKTELRKTFKESSLPKYTTYLEKIASENDGGYLVGSMLSVADIAFFDLTEKLILAGNEDLFKDCPTISSLYERVKSLPNIAKWLKERPLTLHPI